MSRNLNRRAVLAGSGSLAAFGLAGCLGGLGGGGSDYPSENPTLMLPYREGTGFDPYMFSLQEPWANQFDVDIRFTVDHVQGGRGARGLTQLQNAEPDGYLFSLFHSTLAANTQRNQDVEYDMKTFTYIGRAMQSTQAFYVK